MHRMLATLGPENDHPAHHQRRSDSDRVEQVGGDHLLEQHPEDHRRHERHQQVDGKTLGTALLGQVPDHGEDLLAKLPDHREDRGQLDDDVEGDCPLTTKTEQIADPRQ